MCVKRIKIPLEDSNCLRLGKKKIQFDRTFYAFVGIMDRLRWHNGPSVFLLGTITQQEKWTEIIAEVGPDNIVIKKK